MDGLIRGNKFSFRIPACNFVQGSEAGGMAVRVKAFLMRKYFVRSVNLWSVEDEESRAFYEAEYSFLKENSRLFTTVMLRSLRALLSLPNAGTRKI